jgi:dGTP triphosphohydrolase
MDRYLPLAHQVTAYMIAKLTAFKGIIWHDGGEPLDQGLKGPWQTRAIRSNTFEVKYVPTAVHKPGIALKGKKRKISSDQAPSNKSMARIELILGDYDKNVDLSRATYDPFYALSPFFSFAVFSEMTLLDIIDSKIQKELDHSRLISTENPTLSNLLYSQQVLKRHIRNLKEPINFMKGLTERPWFEEMASEQRQRSCAQTIEAMLNDYRAALAYAEALAAECGQGMGIVAHNATIQESQKAMAEARGVTKLTRLAVVFVPLSFVTSVFSMNVRELNVDNGPPLWYWMIVSVAVGFVTLVSLGYDLSSLIRWTRSLAGRTWTVRGQFAETKRQDGTDSEV